MTPKERAAMQQALDAMDECAIDGKWYETKTALREALAEQAEQEPAAKHWHDLYREKCQELHDERARLGAEIVALEQAEQEPVAIVRKNAFNNYMPMYIDESKGLPEGTPLYAAPVRTKDLTDDEIHNIRWHKPTDIDFARAVIAADREKNK